jgi:Sulfotransferase domain
MYRCGTTWWFRQIVLHPQVLFVRGTHRKEVHFFDSLAGVDVLSPDQRAQYAGYFPRQDPTDVTGEWTPRYVYEPWVAPLLAQAAPRARVLMMLRDPVDRYVSGVKRSSRWLDRRAGKVGLTLESIVAEQRGISLYAAHLGRLLESFPREQVLIIQYERCLDHYDDELERTYGFLGLDSSFRPPPRRNRPVPPAAGEAPDAEQAALAREFAADVRRLVEIAPEIDVSLWPSVRDLV